MKFSKGYYVPKQYMVNEGFQIKNETTIMANIDDVNIERMLYNFIDTLEYPSFFFLEIPLNKQQELKLRKKDTDPFHTEVYYIDGRTKDELKSILKKFGRLLIEDGLSTFGFGSNIKPLEICCTKYNIVYIYTNEIEKYAKFLKDIGINHLDRLITAWDTFTQSDPGRSEIAVIDGKKIYDLVQEYKDWGMYKAEIRED